MKRNIAWNILLFISITLSIVLICTLYYELPEEQLLFGVLYVVFVLTFSYIIVIALHEISKRIIILYYIKYLILSYVIYEQIKYLTAMLNS
jgi:hypothetical protein